MIKFPSSSFVSWSQRKDFLRYLQISRRAFSLFIALKDLGGRKTFLRDWQSMISKLQHAWRKKKSPWGGSLLPCSQRLSTTWLDHEVSVIYDHIFRSAAFGLTTLCFFSACFLLAAATAHLMLWPIFRWPLVFFRGASFDHILDHSAEWTTWKQ